MDPLTTATAFLTEAQHNNELLHEALVNEAKRRQTVAEALVSQEEIEADPAEIVQMLRDAVRLTQLAGKVQGVLDAAGEDVEVDISDSESDDPRTRRTMLIVCEWCEHDIHVHIDDEDAIFVDPKCSNCMECQQ